MNLPRSGVNAFLGSLVVTAALVWIAGGPSILLSQPVEPGRFRPADLVELVRLDSTIRLDIRYATAHNFTGTRLYDTARAFLQRPAAEALIRAHRALMPMGYGILVYDAYRPWSVTKKFWDVTPRAKRIYVANPAKGSKHNRGCAVDVGLYDLATLREVRMPSAFDDFSPKAAAEYPGGTDGERRARAILRTAMEAEGFRVNPDEWWHFDYRDWKEYRILNLPFDQIRPATSSGSSSGRP